MAPRFIGTLIVAAAVASAPPATAQTLYTWTGLNSQPQIINDPIDWSNPFNWSGNSIPPSNANTDIQFSVSPTGLSNQNLSNPFIVGFLQTNVGLNVVGSPFDIRGNGTYYPQIYQNTASSVIISNNLIQNGSGLFMTGSGGTVTLNGAISGTGSFSQGLSLSPTIGNYTTILGYANNSYSGATYINNGTLRTSVAGALPAGKDVYVYAGTLDLAGNNQSIGNLTLSNVGATTANLPPVVDVNNGTLTLGGGVTYSPGSNSLHASIYDSGPNGAINLGGSTRTFAVAHSIDPSSTYDLSILTPIIGLGGLTKTGTGFLYLPVPCSYSGPTQIIGGNGGGLILGYTDVLPTTTAVSLTSGGVLIAGAGPDPTKSYNQTIGSLSGSSGIVDINAATLTVGTDNTSTTYSGTLEGGGSATSLVKVGSGTLTLLGVNNSFTGNMVVNGGVLAAGNDSTLLAGVPITVNAGGTFRFANSTTTSRTFTLNSGRMDAPAGTTLTLSGATINGGFLKGPGTFVVTNSAALNGVTSLNSTMISQTGRATFFDFSNGGSLSIANSLFTPSVFDGFVNQGSGTITVGGGSTVNASDFQTYGNVTLNPGSSVAPTQLTNAGSSPLYFNGGSRTFISIPANAGNFDAGIDLHGNSAVVAGGLFVNNGYVVDSVGAGTKTVVADFGSLVKGAGFYQNSVQTINGGKFQSGNSPGKASFGSFSFGPGGVSNYIFAVDDATGTAGPSPNANGLVSGWGLVTTVQRLVGGTTTTGDFAWTATPTNELTVSLDTLVNPTTVGTDIAGPMADFDPTKPYSWLAASWAGSYNGPTDPAVLTASTVFDSAGFVNPMAGTFGWSLNTGGHSLSLTYTPSAVPEPGTLVLTALAGVGLAMRRRRQSRVAGTPKRETGSTRP